MTIEIVDLPIYPLKRVMFHKFLYVYQRVNGGSTSVIGSENHKKGEMFSFDALPVVMGFLEGELK